MCKGVEGPKWSDEKNEMHCQKNEGTLNLNTTTSYVLMLSVFCRTAVRSHTTEVLDLVPYLLVGQFAIENVIPHATGT